MSYMEMMIVKISVIVPVYNTEKYLNKCIKSIVRQTYSNWELIIIDDGSTDGSGELIDKAAKKDHRIIAIHQKNAGPGKARNTGLNLATGDYVVFIDSDDFIDKDYFSLLATKALKNDVVYIDVDQISSNGNVLCKEYISRYKLWDKEKILRNQMTGKIPWGGVRKAVSTKLLRNNNIGFTSHSVGEEALYSFCVLQKAKTVGFIDEKPVYFYVNHENSQSKLHNIDPLNDVVKCMTAYMQSNRLYQKYADTLNAFNDYLI